MPTPPFHTPLLRPAEVLDPQQGQRGAALLLAHDVMPNGDAEDHVMLAEYVYNGAGGYVFLDRSLSDLVAVTDEPMEDGPEENTQDYPEEIHEGTSLADAIASVRASTPARLFAPGGIVTDPVLFPSGVQRQAAEDSFARGQGPG